MKDKTKLQIRSIYKSESVHRFATAYLPNPYSSKISFKSISNAWNNKSNFSLLSVLRAKGLLTKGKNGTNNCFATIEVGKEKYATSIKDSAPPVLEWHEECELYVFI